MAKQHCIKGGTLSKTVGITIKTDENLIESPKLMRTNS